MCVWEQCLQIEVLEAGRMPLREADSCGEKPRDSESRVEKFRTSTCLGNWFPLKESARVKAPDFPILSPLAVLPTFETDSEGSHGDAGGAYSYNQSTGWKRTVLWVDKHSKLAYRVSASAFGIDDE